RPVLAPGLYAALVLMVFVTTLVTPASLQWSLKKTEASSPRGPRARARGGIAPGPTRGDRKRHEPDRGRARRSRRSAGAPRSRPRLQRSQSLPARRGPP